MKNFDDLLKKYARLTIKTGVNLNEKQTLFLSAPITASDFVHEIVKEAYQCGALNVHVNWYDENLSLIKYENACDEAFDHFPKWLATVRETLATEGAAFLSIISPNPDLLKGVDPTLIARSNKASGIALEGYRSIMSKGNVRWSIASIPSPEWATKVFPDINESEAIEKLWKNIFSVTRVDTDDPVAAWDKHISLIKEKSSTLNEVQYKTLHFKSDKTDLLIDLPKDHVWVGGGLYDHNDIYYIPNLPTEETFTAPLRTGVNGVVASTKPLNYGGNVIDNFTLTFKDGRIVDYSAEIGYDILKGLIETDEGSHYIGEVALVPDDSPISNTNLIFYNTLFDENASCHLAIGRAYANCIKGGESMTSEERLEKGLNISLTHVDFMIGSPDLTITGITQSGKENPIFVNGNWA